MTRADEAFDDDYDTIEAPSGEPLWTAEEVTAAGIDVRHVWTVVESSDSDDMYVIPGWHVVNRVDYVVTVEPWLNEAQEYIWYKEE